MENPYASDYKEPWPSSNFGAADPGLVSHVRIVGILSMVEGVLELLYGLMMGAMAFFMPAMMAQNPAFQEGNANAPPIETILLVTYGGMAGALLLTSILHLVGGYSMYQFKSRTLCIASLIFGLLSVFGCYCIPTTVGLSVYGLIVLFNNRVIDAFAMRQQGRTPNEILVAFLSGRT